MKCLSVQHWSPGLEVQQQGAGPPVSFPQLISTFVYFICWNPCKISCKKNLKIPLQNQKKKRKKKLENTNYTIIYEIKKIRINGILTDSNKKRG